MNLTTWKRIAIDATTATDEFARREPVRYQSRMSRHRRERIGATAVLFVILASVLLVGAAVGGFLIDRLGVGPAAGVIEVGACVPERPAERHPVLPPAPIPPVPGRRG